MPEIEEIDDDEAQRVLEEQELKQKEEEVARQRALKEGDRRRAVDIENQKQRELRQKRIDDQKAKTKARVGN